MAIAIQASHGIVDLLLELFTPSLALTVLILVVLLGIWRLIAILDALNVPSRSRRRSRRLVGVVAALVLVTVGVHGALGYYAWSLYQAGSQIFFLPDPDIGVGPQPGVTVGPGQTLAPVPTPLATPATATSRINVLLTGIDSGPGRSHALNDSLIVVSIDPKTKGVVMVSFPRDLAQLPLWDGRTYPGKINSLMTYAQTHRSEFPDGGLVTLEKELGFLLGIPIHYYATIDLTGFVKMVDLVGGVDIVNQTAMNDPGYGGWTNGHPIGFQLTVGSHHLDGQTALAYVRSRKGAGDNDFNRSRRQQQLLVALGKKLADPTMLAKIPGLVAAAGDTIRTNFPPDRLSDVLDIGMGVDAASIKQYVLGPSAYAGYPAQPTGVYELIPNVKAIAALSIKLFGADSSYAASTGASTGASPAP